MNAPTIRPVILSGGAGTRLWPLSRTGRPKQFLALAGEESLLRSTARRAAGWGAPIVVAAREQALAVRAEVPDARLVLEPCARGTAAAVALAALAASESELLLVMPSDHRIDDDDAFRAAVATAGPLARDGWLVTFGIAPDRAETGYGYIKRGEELAPGVFRAARFAEKPDRATAESWLAEGGWDWNAGIFLFERGALLAALREHAPEILAAAEGDFAESPSASIDTALMEKAEKVAVVPAAMGWSDIGSWEALHALGPLDGDGNLLSGDVVAPDSRNCLVRSDGPVVVALGVEDLVIVATERAVLVVPRGETQRVREAIEALEARRVRRGES
ncbi:MAG TPA: sugar phosphate nucleotidyltransferase [Allosphingosinicella sp.]|jgi:mannose-1-phosphate guanylyltransferase/mannose-1-phosphate guanylyltransferase/mannose-6-phosphate isomerase|nr:sugar phosphate nucleotidyltransferase [Allosphingosinicella sp.]